MHSRLCRSKDKEKGIRHYHVIKETSGGEEILVAEMDNHWKYLSTRADTLRELSCLFASETLKSIYL